MNLKYSPDLKLAIKHKLPTLGETSYFSAEAWAIY